MTNINNIPGEGGTSNYASNISNILLTNINNQSIVALTRTTTAIPSSTSTIGGSGDRIILWKGSGSTFPYSIGIGDTSIPSTIWFSGPSATQYNWYANDILLMNLLTTGILTVKDDIIAFGNLSDRKLKTNICNLSINCLDLINTIKAVEFNWKDSYYIPERKWNTLDHGFIAQDIEQILPNLVNSEGQYKSLKYDKFAPYLVKGIQELYKLVQDQQEEINEIKSKIKSKLNQN